MLTVLLVRPRPSPETIGLQHVMIVEPLELEVLGALAPPHRPIIVDMILEKKPLAYFLELYHPDVVCITGYITHVQIMIDYCAEVKRIIPSAVTVVGGVHCEVCPHHFNHPSIDYRVVRNAAIVFKELLEFLDKKTAFPPGVLVEQERVEGKPLPEYDFRVPFPDRSLTNRYRSSYFYIFHDRVALLKTAFGIPNQCRFCFCKTITGGRYATRPMDEVITELRSIKEDDVYIVDDDFLACGDRLITFINEIERTELQKKFLVYGRADFIAANPSLMARFKKAGLATIIVGFESFFDDELSGYGKGVDSSVNREALRILNLLSIDCYATIIAPPQWDRDRFGAITAILQDLGVHYVNIQPLTPLPGTAMAAAPGELLLKEDDFAKWDLAHVSLRPTKLSVADFYREMVRAYDRILFQPGVLIAYIKRYRLSQLWKMAAGSFRVRLQYGRKIREVQKRASGENDGRLRG